MKLVAPIADGTGTVDVHPDRVQPVMPTMEFDGKVFVPHPSGRLLTPYTLEMEREFQQVRSELARRYGVPYRSSNVNAANALDAQAAYESVFSLWGAIQGGVNLLMHGAGWMEGGLHASYEKMILDAELLGMVAAFLEPVVVDEETLAFSAMEEVGPGGHFFGAEHTQSRYKTAFHKPMLSDWRNYETWEEAGSPELPSKANRMWKELLAAYEPPPMDPAIREELDAFVARRVAEGGVPTDY